MKSKMQLLFLLCITNLSIYAFRPIGHVLLKDKIVDSLPKSNRFKIAMEKYPQIASWGAVGPDLGYNVDLSRTFQSAWKRQIKNSMQIADLAHYHMVGSFVANLITKADEIKDEKFYAFVGGWITHIAGDFGSHGILVKPEAGFYIAYEGGRELHSELEKMADTYLYSCYAKDYGLSGWDYNLDHYWEKFFGVKPEPKNRYEKKQNEDTLVKMIGGKVEESFIEVYKKTYDLKEVNINLVYLASTYYRAVGGGLGKRSGFIQYSILELTDKIFTRERRHNIDSAFNEGKIFGYKYLTNADNPYEIFSNTWNLDIGENGEPTYVIRIDPDDKLISRTKNDLYLTFKQKNGIESPPMKLTTKVGPLKFAFYQKDICFYALNMGGALGELDCWKLENVASVKLTIRPRHNHRPTNVFRIKKAKIFYNGKVVAEKSDADPKKSMKLKKTNPITFLF